MCSYCGCESIEVIGRFMAEHVEIINATGALRSAVRTGDPGAVESGEVAVAALLWPHTAAEEGRALPRPRHGTRSSPSTSPDCAASTRPWTGYLAGVTPGDEPAMARFEDALRDHIDKEDNGLFPAAAIALDGEQWTEVHDSTPHGHGGPRPRTVELEHDPAHR